MHKRIEDLRANILRLPAESGPVKLRVGGTHASVAASRRLVRFHQAKRRYFPQRIVLIFNCDALRIKLRA